MQTHVVLSNQAEICIIFSLGQGGGIQLYMAISEYSKGFQLLEFIVFDKTAGLDLSLYFQKLVTYEYKEYAVRIFDLFMALS